MASNVDKQIDVVDGTITQAEADAPEYNPIYRVFENSRIPVSKSVGKLWKMRWSEGKRLLEHTGDKDRWNEAIAYYQNDHGARSNKRSGLSELGDGETTSKKFGSENIVFANVSSLVPATYAKNPDVEITSVKSENEARAQLYERLIDQLFNRKNAPGLNLKPKIRRMVVTTTLTNISYLELSYVRKDESSEEVVAQIEALSKELAEAKKPEEIREVEGKLQALEHRVSFLSPSGPSARFLLPDMVFGDPNREDEDICSGSYIIIGEYVRTDFLRAMYGRKDENGEWMSIYQPSHVLSGSINNMGHDDEINNFTLLDSGAEHESYGYKSRDEFEHNCHTLCWKVWDKTTRRVLMFNDKDWTWPIWVWDDPYNLTRFFPVFGLSYYTDPKSLYARSEVMYYLDQQDEINEINNERARMRHWAMSKVFVDSNAVKDATKFEKFLKDDTDHLVHGLDIPDGKRLSDIISAFPAPSTQFEGLFDSRPLLESINRLSSVTPVLQNVQFKTNTTNRAIESYESSTQMRLDEKIDAIEELLADVGRALLEMCVQFMTTDEVVMLLGESFVTSKGGWVEAQEVSAFNEEFNLSIVGGSTLKPTAKVKKDQAMQLGQILGQFANASPMLVIVMLKMLERAFSDDVVITPEEWSTIVNATSKQMERGVSTQGGAKPQTQGQPTGQPQQGQPTGDEGGNVGLEAAMAQIEQLVMQLPPQAKKFLGTSIAQGVPLKQIIMQIVQSAQQQQPQQRQQQLPQ